MDMNMYICPYYMLNTFLVILTCSFQIEAILILIGQIRQKIVTYRKGIITFHTLFCQIEQNLFTLFRKSSLYTCYVMLCRIFFFFLAHLVYQLRALYNHTLSIIHCHHWRGCWCQHWHYHLCPPLLAMG